MAEASSGENDLCPYLNISAGHAGLNTNIWS
jgi:hypothetical protein